MNDLSRGRNNANSRQAFQNIAGTIESMRVKVLDKIDGLKCTAEIAEELGVPIHTISGRFSELKANHKIRQISNKKIKRSSFAVYIKINS
ncbi:hypothetical protein U9K52_10000 [Chryseobacterium sp. MHB01]|uniref:hypothetical protein n=1 Tax=Chryseobacterium sp. MHB01 TaxID=3109433 RepID=UPI002AFED938|nr:hypothetical protein [Chryseobacterium sp. MHB01]MEA1849245.1 hypothetical protein [Chryseobacterium sp. MHB01]